MEVRWEAGPRGVETDPRGGLWLTITILAWTSQKKLAGSMSRAGRRGFADNDKMLFITKAWWSSFREMVQKWVVFAFLGTTACSGRREEEKKRKKKMQKKKGIKLPTKPQQGKL